MGNGGIELHIELCQYAELSEKIVDFISNKLDIDFPGIYDYEVSEPFGTWFAECIFATGDAPTRERATQWLANEAAAFFLQGQPLQGVAGLRRTELYNKLLEHLA